MLGSLAVDTVFPLAGLYRMGYWRARENEDMLRRLSEGESFWWVDCWWLTAGSSAEGLAVDKHWGHGKADEDNMLLCGGDLVVHVLPPGQQPPENATLVYTPQQCPPAYCRLQVLHKDKLPSAVIRCSLRKDLSVSDPKVQKCMFKEDGRLWLHSQHTLEVAHFSDIEAISGPAGQRYNGLVEHIYSLVCSGPHPAMASYRERTRKHWPSTSLLDAMMKQPMLLVMVGPKGIQDSYLMFRISWSTLEIILSSSLEPWLKQGFVCFKYTFKSVLKSLRPDDSTKDGRSRVGSYHLKTVFLRYLEEHPLQLKGSPFQLMMELCQGLQRYLLMGCLSHYFLPECDLLQTVGDEERQYALQAVGQIISDPLVAILRSPLCTKDIYGDQSPDDLVRCFNDASSQPSCPFRHEGLQRLLHLLDKHREGIYQEQLDWDRRNEVRGRPGLDRLIDYLQGHRWIICAIKYFERHIGTYDIFQHQLITIM